MTHKPTARPFEHIAGCLYPGVRRFERLPGVTYPPATPASSRPSWRKPPAKTLAESKAQKAAESKELAGRAQDLLAKGKTKAEVSEALGVSRELIHYHMAKNGLEFNDNRDPRFSVTKFVMTDAMFLRCKELRPHTSWDDIAAELGANRSTIIKHFQYCTARHEQAA